MLQEKALRDAALQVFTLLRSGSNMLVLAESCTSGAIAAALGVVPGLSAHFCGSHVIYRNPSKQLWLGIAIEILDGPGPVSAECSRAICEAALKKTPEASLSLAITGDLGPGADAERDGMTYVCIKRRGEDCQEISHHLSAPPPRDSQDILGREMRQKEATLFTLKYLADYLRKA